MPPSLFNNHKEGRLNIENAVEQAIFLHLERCKNHRELRPPDSSNGKGSNTSKGSVRRKQNKTQMLLPSIGEVGARARVRAVPSGRSVLSLSGFWRPLCGWLGGSREEGCDSGSVSFTRRKGTRDSPVCLLKVTPPPTHLFKGFQTSPGAWPCDFWNLLRFETPSFHSRTPGERKEGCCAPEFKDPRMSVDNNGKRLSEKSKGLSNVHICYFLNCLV